MHMNRTLLRYELLPRASCSHVRRLYYPSLWLYGHRVPTSIYADEQTHRLSRYLVVKAKNSQIRANPKWACALPALHRWLCLASSPLPDVSTEVNDEMALTGKENMEVQSKVETERQKRCSTLAALMQVHWLKSFWTRLSYFHHFKFITADVPSFFTGVSSCNTVTCWTCYN